MVCYMALVFIQYLPPTGSPWLDVQNSGTCKGLEEGITLKIQKEISLGRISRPYSYVPIDNLHISLLSAILKAYGVSVRLLTNLSAPYDGTSINSNIPDSKKRLKYASIRDAVKEIQSLKARFGSVYLAKTDVQAAFRLLSIKPAERHLHGFVWNQQYHLDLCLIMGTASSPRTFSLFSKVLVWMAVNKFEVEGPLGCIWMTSSLSRRTMYHV